MNSASLQKLCQDRPLKDLKGFSDATARNGSIYSVHKKHNGDFLINKLNGGYHSGIIDKQSGAFRQIPSETAENPYLVLSFREYKNKYLISFMFGGSIYISENGQVLFKFNETVKPRYPVAEGYNFTRIVDLRDDQLYFLNASEHLVQIDLAVFLSSADKAAYRGKVLTATPIIDFCVSADHTVTTITQTGLLNNLRTGHSTTINSTNRGGMFFTSIEQLNDRIVTEGFNQSTKKKYYIVLDPNFKEVASAEVPGEYSVHNMELFIRDGRLWILAANQYQTVDYLVLNANQLVLVQTLKLGSSNRTYGLIWKEVGEEAIVFGDLSLIKSFKL